MTEIAKGMATISDVAHRAGVARTTVSHALSGKRPVAPETRERVLAAVRELGYQPNAAARSLALRRTGTVGLSLPLDFLSGVLPEGPFFQFIASAAERLSDHGYKLLCLISRDLGIPDLVRLAQTGQVDGMLLLQVRLDDARIAALRSTGLPFVAIGRSDDGIGIVRVDADLAAASEIAVDHLYGLGHRRFALLTAVLNGAPVYGFQYHALHGFQSACHARGIPHEQIQVLAYDPVTGPREVVDPLVEPRGPTALVTTTDYEAVAALHELAERGRHVPDDVSIVTLVDSVLTALARPPITVVRFSVADETRTAVDLLVNILAGRAPRQLEHIVPVELLVRASTRRVVSRES